MHYPGDAFPAPHGCPQLPRRITSPRSPGARRARAERTPFCLLLGSAGSLNYSLKIILPSPGSFPSYSCGVGEAARSEAAGRRALPGPDRWIRRLGPRRRGGFSTTVSSERAARPGPAPRPRPRPRTAGRSPVPGRGARSVPAPGRPRSACRSSHTPPAPEGTRRALPAALSAPERRLAPARNRGAAPGRAPLRPPPRFLGRRGAWDEGKPPSGSRCGRRGRSLPSGRGRMPRAPVVPSLPAPPIAQNRPPLAPPPPPPPAPPTGRVQSSLPPPALAAPGAPQRATLGGRERAGGAGRAENLGRPEVTGPSPLPAAASALGASCPPAAAAVGDVARRGAAGV